MAAPPTLEEMRLACANADTDSNRFGKPIASNASAPSPARSDDSEVYTQVELEAWEDTLEVTSNSTGDKRTSSPKPKPPPFPCTDGCPISGDIQVRWRLRPPLRPVVCRYVHSRAWARHVYISSHVSDRYVDVRTLLALRVVTYFSPPEGERSNIYIFSAQRR